MSGPALTPEAFEARAARLEAERSGRATARQLRDVREGLTVAIATLNPHRTPQRVQEAMYDAHHHLTQAMVDMETAEAHR